MVKKIQVIGAADESGTITLKMDKDSLTVKTGEVLTAKSLFEFFHFERGITYEVECTDMGEVQKGVYEAFCKLINDIAAELSSIELKEIEDNEDSGQGEPSD